MKADRPWYVLTGGPGSGKTTTIEALAARGYRTVPEVARRLFKERMDAGETIEMIRGDMVNFQHQVIDEIMKEESRVSSDEMVFLDRGMIDGVAYHRFFGIPEDAKLHEALEKSSYRKAFVLDMVDFKNDDERKESRDEALRLHDMMRAVYEEQGIETLRVAVLPVEERVDFILANL